MKSLVEYASLDGALYRPALSTDISEHGIGLGKMGSMRMELGDDMMDLMRDIKRVFDPDNLMNPGKILPEA